MKLFTAYSDNRWYELQGIKDAIFDYRVFGYLSLKKYIKDYLEAVMEKYEEVVCLRNGLW